MEVVESKRAMVNGLIYPAPDPRHPFLGVHVTKIVNGSLQVGPNAISALKREGYRRSAVDLGGVRDIVSWPGFWRLARRHWKVGAGKLWGSLSERACMAEAQRSVSGIDPYGVVRARSGIRTQALDRDGSLVDDLRIYGNMA